ncbi:MAG: excinuclease ABC subunit A [Candidatus Moranbacteria bacterium RIFOXYB1_FULL_43_19]|nr:MAG: excinuclease ABC subunit A [Candidatus Moranbacteria bacterium RIFOXYB1_FULL_43_19]OGI28739.1 MAG: excinuclease ABC subunit A [Candidatus Moranbacteria bacterium RIFOXYA1_FULL_44_7]OGI33134.1 MAG: excinuclease ABC subunit A [Candidatus Moranbacteria bacterium RIFOXYC1_FULL_44_13]OGI38670.1 MAG: excinuclease ABC subunit A [Candidatus Moranbacteria bacterium RIFOXYD1_FULL_44_12]
MNNLKNISVKIPRDKIVVITGLSGSGKSSLAFDTIFAEGHRRYVENLSVYARQFLNVSKKPDVDKIENLSPVIAINQVNVNRSPRSTVGTMTEIYDYFRILFAQIGKPHCPKCGVALTRKTAGEVAEETISLALGEEEQIAVLAPIQIGKENAREKLSKIKQSGYARLRVNKKIMTADQLHPAPQNTGKSFSSNDLNITDSKMWCGVHLAGADTQIESLEIVVDRIAMKNNFQDKERLIDSIETAMKLGKGEVIIASTGNGRLEKKYNRYLVCSDCQVTISEITPRHFSFNNPEGACPACSGLGTKLEVDVSQIIPNKKLTLKEGAVKPWSGLGLRGGIQNGYHKALEALSKKYGFSLDKPIEDLPKNAFEILFKGDWELGYEGIVPSLERKYREANSEFVRSEIEKYMISKICPVCQGKRLKPESLFVKIGGKSIDDISRISLDKFNYEIKKIIETESLSASEKKLFNEIFKETEKTVDHLAETGLGYLNLSRNANSLSGGEAQRVRLATQIGSGLTGILYVLDEPSIGLHERDTEKLVNAFRRLKEEGSSVIVVEHDGKIIRSADWIVDMGPGAGDAGGEIIFEGSSRKLLTSKTSTGEFLRGKKKVFEKKKFRKGNGKKIEILGASENNLRDISASFPLGKFVAIAGVSGSGKSTLVEDILARALRKYFWKTKDVPGAHKKIKGFESISKVVSVDQSPIGRTPRSNAATYTGIFSHVRDIFADTDEAKKRGYAPSRFSFNMKGGRCEACQGEGQKKIEMHLLPDIYAPCEICNGTRFNAKTLEIEYQGVNVAEVLDMSVDYALRFFHRFPLVVEKLRTLSEVGLGYLKLGQSAMNLSGGEAQRIKLSTELARRTNGKTLYILDEPTIGLHFEDVARLLKILDELVEKGNTVLVVEHNPDVLRAADWVIELGPEGGEEGGQIVFEGTPDKLARAKTWTGKYMGRR